MRFDTLVQHFTRGGADSTIYTLDSAVVNILLDTTGTKATQPVTIELYDVDTTAVDTAVSTALALFRPDRLIGAKTYAVTELKDSLHVPLENDKVLRSFGATRHDGCALGSSSEHCVGADSRHLDAKAVAPRRSATIRRLTRRCTRSSTAQRR